MLNWASNKVCATEMFRYIQNNNNGALISVCVFLFKVIQSKIRLNLKHSYKEKV